MTLLKCSRCGTTENMRSILCVPCANELADESPELTTLRAENARLRIVLNSLIHAVGETFCGANKGERILVDDIRPEDTALFWDAMEKASTALEAKCSP